MNSGGVFVRSVTSSCAAICFVAICLLCQRVLGLQQSDAGASRLASAGVYSTEQANRGQSVYMAQCAQCHGEPLAGTEFGPALIGDTFATDFSGSSVGDLFDRIQATMPQSNPGGLSRAEALDVIAYVLKSNDFPAGGMALPADASTLKSIKIDLKKPDERPDR